ncbi:MAG: pyridoxal phosphate-dependent aminotransferase [Desulfobacteraceae bacterium]|nr:pyridoxal phosphate-dependent aminotransferase [Desulfobacteraceae bacterium]MBC2755614.1 pyridoxal phosphate-dependent aminotransferase [Desulfobacteraceae bacterium]
MTIAKQIEGYMSSASWIRKMFEEGAKLKAEHGADNVFDFSLGNPNLSPPTAFNQKLKALIESEKPGSHAYMPNPGYPYVRQAVAKYLSKEHSTDITENEILMTCGAAGGLNVILKTILDPGDEILTPAPFFVEYKFYAENHNGKLIPVKTKPDFTLDLEAIEAAITSKTKAVIINSPNNPTGQIYSKESLNRVGSLLRTKSLELGRTIYLISDEPYRKIIYDGAKVPSIYHCYPESIITTSYSKDLSLPGERIGYIAVNPSASFLADLINGMSLANRILGFVNAPALMQRVIAELQGETVDVSQYAKNRELLCNGLEACGYEFIKPPGAFYLFPQSPIADDVEFVQALQEELILAVPGTGFGGPGHFRIAFCVAEDTIANAMPGFAKAIEKFK